MTEPNKPRVSPLALLGDGLLLLCALVGLTGSFLSLYQATAPTAMDTAVNAPAADALYSLALYTSGHAGELYLMAALFALLALGAWSLPRFRLPTAGGLTAVWIGTALWNWKTFLLGARLTCSAVSILCDRRLHWGMAYRFDCELTAAEQLAALEFFLTLALALLALIVGWAVVRGRCWWIVVLFTLPPLLPGLLADLYPDWPAFMALCACWCTMLVSSLCQNAAPASRGRLSLTVLPAVALVLAGLTLALPMEGYTRPAWTYTAQDALISWSSRLSQFFDGWNGPFRGGVTYVGSAETVNLKNAGPLNYSGRPVLRVTSDYEGHLYLRGTALAVYDGGSWTALPDGAYQEYLEQLSGQHLTPTPLVFPALLNPPERTYTATVTNVGASGSCVYTPYQLVEQDWEEAGVLPVEDTFLARRQSQWTQTTTFMPLEDALAQYYSTDPDGVSFSVLSAQSIATSQETVYRDYVREHYLDVPEELRPLLENFFREQELYYSAPSYSSLFFSGSPLSADDVTHRYVPISYAAQVADALGRLYEYDPATPLTPEGRDFVEYFLTESERGYCMHFASAAALLLRTMGIPARYVSGFTADTVARQQVDVPDWAAHAWVEIYIDGYGWYPVEVTPGYDWDATLSETGPDATDAPSEQASQPVEESEPVPSDEPLPSLGPQDGPDVPGPGGGSAVLSALIQALAALAGFAALLWLGQYLPKRLRAAAQSGPDANRAALYSYRCLLRLKRWGGEVDEEAFALAQKARFSQHTLVPEERQAMADKVDRQRLRLLRRLSPVKRVIFLYWWGKPKRDIPKEATP